MRTAFRSPVFLVAAVASLASIDGGRAAADGGDVDHPRANPEWQKSVAAAKEALLHDRLADARDFAFAAQHIGDTAEVSALLAVALHGLGLIADDVAQVSHAALMAERCLQQLQEPDPDLDATRRDGVRLTCLSVAARAYLRLGVNNHAHERAVACLAMPAPTPVAARMQRPCHRVFDDTEREGFGVLGGTWWKYAVVTGQVGYGFRYFPSTGLSSPGQRVDGMTLGVSVGYPNFSLGPLLLRPEVTLRWDHLGDEIEEGARSAFTILSVGGRLMLTYPSRFMTLEFGFGVSGSQLRVLGTGDANKLFLYLKPGDKTPVQFISTSWSPEISGVIHWGTPELRFGKLSFLFTAFLEITQMQDAAVTSVDPDAATGHLINQKLTSIGVLFGVGARLRIGELKPYF